MTSFEILPLIGVGPVRFGMTRDGVHSLLGRPKTTRGSRRESFLGGFYVDYDDVGTVEFIEMASSDQFSLSYQGICLHRVTADEAVKFISRFDQFDESHPEHGYTFMFPKLQLSLWRGTVPEAEQEPDDMDGHYFEAVGIGRLGYFH